MIQDSMMSAKVLVNHSVASVRGIRIPRILPANSLHELPLSSNKIGNRAQWPGWVLFAREILHNYRAMGTPCESSLRLAKTIASAVPLTEAQFVVELGSGTGIVTEALLQHGVTPEKFVSIERSASLVEYSRQRCPQARIIKGDARNLCELLGNDCQQVSTIVSSLPFRSLPQTVGRSIVKQIDKVLPKNGLFVQFTYDLSGRRVSLPHRFKYISGKIVWRNMPPARVDVFRSEQ